MTRRWILLLYVLPALFLAAGSLPFLFSDLDLRLARQFYNESADLWTYGNRQPWAALYQFGVIPAIAAAILAFYTVAKHPDGWSVTKAGSERATSVHATKKEAIASARETARAQAPSRLTVLKADGSVSDEVEYEA